MIFWGFIKTAEEIKCVKLAIEKINLEQSSKFYRIEDGFFAVLILSPLIFNIAIIAIFRYYQN